MKDILLKNKIGYRSIRTIKIIALLVLALSFLPIKIFGATTTIGFETSEGYLPGSINGQKGWAGSASSTVDTSAKYNGDYGLDLPTVNLSASIYFSTSTAGEISFWLKIDGANYFQAMIDFYDTVHTTYVTLQLIKWPDNTIHITDQSGSILYCSPYDSSIFHFFRLLWDFSVSTTTVSLDCGSGIVAYPALTNGTSTSAFNHLSFETLSYNWGSIYFDDLIFPYSPPPPPPPPVPGDYDADPQGCGFAGFCWYWAPINLFPQPEYGGYCDYCDETSCGIDIFSCGACDSSSTCAATDLCEWNSTTSICLLKDAYECGAGYKCGYCYTTSTCATAGCEWNDYSGKCLFAAPVATSTTDLGVFGNWLRDALIWLFAPDTDYLSHRVIDLFSVIKTRFPFGYLTYIVDLVNQQAAIAGAVGENTLPVYSIVFQGHELTVLNFAEAKEKLPVFFNLFHTLISLTLWLGLLFHIYSRVKNSDVGV